jgi:alpha-glucosidase
VRPLFWRDPDPALRDADDAFLVGEHVLVAPILDDGARARDVRLPSGTWIDLHTGQRQAGGRAVHVEAPLERMPVFVKAGALVPMDVGGALELHAWPDEAGRATGALYHDEGDGYGPWCRLAFTLDATGPEPRLESTREGDGPAPEPAPRVVVHR